MAATLPPLSNVERLSPLVVRVLGGNPGKVCDILILDYFFPLFLSASLGVVSRRVGRAQRLRE